MSALHDYLRNCLATRTKVNLLLKGQPPKFIESEIRSFNDDHLWIGSDKPINLNEIIGFPENDI
jgi:hypothetical protein